jgi:hypothetical protein
MSAFCISFRFEFAILGAAARSAAREKGQLNMRFYRNHYHCEGGASGGFTWFTTKAEAIRDAREHDDGEDEGDKTDPIAEPIDIAPTKAGILHALNRYADHPDNG